MSPAVSVGLRRPSVGSTWGRTGHVGVGWGGVSVPTGGRLKSEASTQSGQEPALGLSTVRARTEAETQDTHYSGVNTGHSHQGTTVTHYKATRHYMDVTTCHGSKGRTPTILVTTRLVRSWMKNHRYKYT